MDHTSMAMPTTFNSSIKVTLFWEAWTTTNLLTYLFTLLFVFFLAFFNRFLAAFRFQIEYSHLQSLDHVAVLAPLRTRRTSKARLSPLPRYTQIDHDETEVETGTENANDQISGCDERSRLVPEDRENGLLNLYTNLRRRLVSISPKWTPTAPWSGGRDGSRALLEGVRAFIGYILMLAVMTFNIGIFCAVLAGIFAGEIVLGRYMRHS